ncbi:MAG: arsenate reductase (glutaredoxin) [Capnocytophaga sp.]|nr:arsenate reductase (glutaredoxin) [Capnocytophaga sp.]
MKIYHNSHCSKSRGCLALLTEKNAKVEIIDYLKNPPSITEIKDILRKLNIPAMELVRKNEPLWKENKKENMTEEEIIELLHNFPKLIERPIVIDGDKAIIARPPERILEWLQ